MTLRSSSSACVSAKSAKSATTAYHPFDAERAFGPIIRAKGALAHPFFSL